MDIGAEWISQPMSFELLPGDGIREQKFELGFESQGSILMNEWTKLTGQV